MTVKRLNRLFNKKTLLITGLVFVVAALGLLSYKLYQSHNRRARTVIPSTSPQASTRTPSTDKNDATNNSSPAAQANNSDKSESSSSTTLIEPSGTFVSNHRPGQNGTPTTEQSVCNTSIGASCYIEFTKGGVSKKLDSQTVDAKGAAYWTWDIKQAGLDAGSWQITAVATLNGQTKTSQDAIALEVQP